MQVSTHNDLHCDQFHSFASQHACLNAAISLDAIDISGTHGDENTLSVAHNGELHKNRINADGSHKGLGEYIAPKKQFGPFFLRRPQEVSVSCSSSNCYSTQVLQDGSDMSVSSHFRAPHRQHLLGLQENTAMNAALDKHEGCNIHGWLEVQRVAGNFHLSVHADHYFAMRSVCYFLHKPAQQPLLSSLPPEGLACSSEEMSR